MNLIQTLPPLSSDNTRFVESLLDHGGTCEVEVFYDAGGPRFNVSESASMADLHARHRLQSGGLRVGFCRAGVERLKQAIADHLSIINPVNND